MKNKNGFSLIELIAVIIILGVVMLIGIPSITKAIDNSRRKAYVEIANRYVDMVRADVASGKTTIDDPDLTYYISYDSLKTEVGEQSPWGPWISAYVVAVYDQDQRKVEYYWTSIDVTGHKIVLKNIEEITPEDIIVDTSLVENDTRRIGYRDHVSITGNGASNQIAAPSIFVTKAEADQCFVYYTQPDNTITIESYNSSCTRDVEIPARIDGKVVKEIGYGAFRSMGITSLYLPEGLEIIGGRAFYSNKITKVIYPTTLKEIGSEAFAFNLLTEINLRSNCTIGSAAYNNNLFSQDSALIYALDSSGNFDYSKIIGYAGTSKNVVIPPVKNGVVLETIGSNCFRSVGLETVSIPSTVKYIESGAFWNNKLKSVELPAGLLTIAGTAFCQNSLESIDIPDSVTTLGDRAFTKNNIDNTSDVSKGIIYGKNSDGSWNYSRITSYAGRNKIVDIPEKKNGVSVTTIGGLAFYGVGLTHVSIPTSVTSIGGRAFNVNSLPANEMWIYERTSTGANNYSKLVGYGGSARANVEIPKTPIDGSGSTTKLKTIGSSAFNEIGLTSVTIPDSVTNIQGSAFRHNKFTELTIPSSVTAIGDYAFYKEWSWNSFNMMSKIHNLSGRSFNWTKIVGSRTNDNFATGTINNSQGPVLVVDN